MERYVPLKETMRFSVWQQVVSFKGTTCWFKRKNDKYTTLVIKHLQIIKKNNTSTLPILIIFNKHTTSIHP